MAFIAPVLASLGGAGAAAGATAASAASAASIWGTVGTIASTVAGLAQISYQNKVATQAAATAQKNSNTAIQEGQTAQKDQDEAAAAQIAQQTAEQASSGFSLASPTFKRINARNRVLARRDAERIRQSSIDTAQNFQTQKAEALSQKQSLLLPAVMGAIDIKSSMISGANLVRKVKSRNTNSQAQWEQA